MATVRREDEFDPGQEGSGRQPIGPEVVPSSGVSAKRIVAGIVILVLVVFAIANFQRVEVNFLLFTTRARVVTVIVVAALLGFVAGWFVGRPSRAERKAMERGLKD
ncbi:MAG: lipopolysaccharide assembly protein LapA domain-containing protein [Solirubrobacterales bacterium]